VLGRRLGRTPASGGSAQPSELPGDATDPLRAEKGMNLSPTYVIAILAGGVCYLVAAYLIDRALEGGTRIGFRYVAITGAVGLFFYAVQRFIDDHAIGVDWAKAGIALTAGGCVLYEQQRIGMRRPISERWKRFIGLTLGLAAIIAYFNGFKFGYPRYYHRWDQYHYYMGAKYFPEMGYDGLYKCGVIAEDELGAVVNSDPRIGPTGRFEMSKEVRISDKKIRNLGGDNLLMPVAEILAHPEVCKDHFSKERWAEYKEDVRFFRIASDKGYWEDMQKDHGFNPPPVWTILGRFFAELAPAGSIHADLTGLALPSFLLWLKPVTDGGFLYLQLLAGLDLLYLLGVFVALWWAFGWRVCAVGAILWGCQSSAPFYWTGGAFLRQDWLFYLVLAACLTRKRYFKLAGASLVYAGLLRIFPGLVVIGWLTVAGYHLVRHRRMPKHHQQMLIGGTLAAAVLLPLSLVACGAGSLGQALREPKAALVAGKDAYQQFYKHTLEVHDRTPLTNHMGLRVLVAHKLGSDASSGRMKYTKDMKLTDPFEVWKRMRNERYDRLRPVAYGIVALCLALFIYVMRRVKSMWVAQCLGQIFIILLSQLTCYYYSFLILTAPLTRLKRGIEVPMFALAAFSIFTWRIFAWNDDRYTALTLISLLFCLGLLCAFAGRGLLDRIRGVAAPAGDESESE
jgi:hypothetical protein